MLKESLLGGYNPPDNGTYYVSSVTLLFCYITSLATGNTLWPGFFL